MEVLILVVVVDATVVLCGARSSHSASSIARAVAVARQRISSAGCFVRTIRVRLSILELDISYLRYICFILYRQVYCNI